MNLNKLLFVFLMISSAVLGQDIPVTQVNIVEGFAPNITDANRLNENATFADTIKKDRTQTYAVVDVNLQSNYITKPLSAAKVKAAKISELYKTRIGINFGSAWTTRTDFIYNSTRSRLLTYGVVANHFSNQYALNKNSKNTLSLYAKSIKSSYILNATFDYDRRTAFFYDEDLDFIGYSKENFRNRFAYTKFSISAMSKEKVSSNLRHHTTFFVTDLNEFSENQINFSSNLNKTIYGLPFSIRVEFDDYFRYNNEDSKIQNTNVGMLSFSPAICILKYGFRFDFSFDVDLSFNQSSSIYPEIKASKILVEDILLIQAGLRHIKQKHSLKSLSDINPYIHSFGTNQSIIGDNMFNQDLRITNLHELYFFMSNVLGKDEVFEGTIAYGFVQNFSHFVAPEHSVYNRFQVNYLDVKQLHSKIRYTRSINKIIKLDLDANYFKWDQQVYYHPSFIANFKLPISLRDKIQVLPLITYISTRKAMNPDGLISDLPFRVDANIGFSYFYSKQLSASLELNNLTNSKKEVWVGYPELGFNMIFGLSYGF